MAWADSDRRATLPSNWRTGTRATVLRRDRNRCTWIAGHPDNDGGFPDYLTGNYRDSDRCTQPARDVDHHGDRRDHRPQACRSLCGPHHDHRTHQQAAAAARANAARRRAQRLRTPEPQPGRKEPTP